jgi:hypothetical protein
MVRTRTRLLALSVSALVVALFSAASAAHAATRNVVAGQLVGASNVNVGGILYDVEFIEGTCISVFGGCDSPDDFTFTDLASVNAASQALVDQVFLDVAAGNFDTDPTTTYGCTNASIGSAQTPYLLVDVDNVAVGIALNGAAEEGDGIGDGQTLRTADSAVGSGQFYVFAVWTPSAVQAATPNVVAGQLVGASNVDVGGILYDVEFVEGTCISVFGGCDSPDDFAFTDLAAVNAASQALVDQVFLDVAAGDFDTDPTTTYGCTNASIGSAQTPYLLVDVDNVAVGIALNPAAEAGDGIGDGPTLRTADSAVGAGQFYVFAVWTPVAAPVVPAVPGLGLLVLAFLLVTGAWIGRKATD